MMKRLLFLAFFLIFPFNTFGYEVNVHREITKKAIASSKISQTLDNIGISLKNEFSDKTASKWIEDGSELEDNSPRWKNHFYDPTTGQGLNVNVYEPVLGTVLFTVSGESSLPWAKDGYLNEYSWKWVRDSYYNALTAADPK